MNRVINSEMAAVCQHKSSIEADCAISLQQVMYTRFRSPFWFLITCPVPVTVLAYKNLYNTVGLFGGSLYGGREEGPKP